MKKVSGESLFVKTEETFHEDMEKVVGRLNETFVYGAEAEKIRRYIRENRKHSGIANLEARLVETEDKYWGTISAINENFVNIPENIIRQYPMILFYRLIHCPTVSTDFPVPKFLANILK